MPCLGEVLEAGEKEEKEGREREKKSGLQDSGLTWGAEEGEDGWRERSVSGQGVTWAAGEEIGIGERRRVYTMAE